MRPDLDSTHEWTDGESQLRPVPLAIARRRDHTRGIEAGDRWLLTYSTRGSVELLPPGATAVFAESCAGWDVGFRPEGLVAMPRLSTLQEQRSPRSIKLPPYERRQWESALTRLEAEIAHRAPEHAAVAGALLTLLLVDFTRAFASRHRRTELPLGRSRQIEALLERVDRVIDARFREKLSLDGVAAAVSISPSHLSRLVRRTESRSVGEWIRDRRMKEARELLSETEQTVEAVAAAVGYTDITHFRRHFQRGHGVSPAKWRRAHNQTDRNAEA